MTEEDEKEKARREAAAARRQRILEGAETRMDVVEGRASTSTSSKLAAMRKRRFKKKTTSEAPAEVAASAVVEETAANKEDAPTTATTTTSPTTVADEDPTAEATTTATSGDEADVAGKKKYMGVARMRRKMIKEKQQQQQQPTTSSTTTTKKRGTTTTTKTPAAYSSVPIIMHVVTVLLLFLAGLDIGLQQASLGRTELGVLDIHTDFAPRHSGGVHWVLQYTTGTSSSSDASETEPKKPHGLAEPVFLDAVQTEEDEFADAASKPLPMDIDPLFGVDLDELTAGPGIVPLAARQAVKVHRFLLQIVYYGPLRFVDWLLSLTTLPPVLCLVAILLRQVIGKTLLGARLPTSADSTTPGGGDDASGTKDVMGMAKNVVTNFLQTTFPTAVSLYDMWGHLRADMYVIFCGLFVGLALGHHPNTQEWSAALLSSAGTTDEL